MNKNVAILRGTQRMVDGETTSVEEMWKWGMKNDVAFHTYYYHSPWKRKEPTYNDGYEHPFTIFTKNNVDEILKELNEKYDLVILINICRPMALLDDDDVLKFHQMYKQIDTVKVLMHHNSFVKSINDTPLLWSYVNESDAVFNHSDESYFMTELVKKLPTKMKRAYPMHLWLDVEQYKDYHKREERLNNITFIGRYSLYKGPKRLLNIAEDVIRAGIQPIIYGMDTIIGCMQEILTHPNCDNRLDRCSKNMPRGDNPIVPTYGKLNRDEVFPKFNETLFAATLFKFKGKKAQSFYGNRMEYTMQEAICAGAILVADKEWAELNCTKDGTRYIDIPNFAIYMDEDNPQPAIDEMEKVSKDLSLQRLYRETAFNLLMREYDSSVVLPTLMTQLFNIIKDEGKFKSDYELVEFLTESKEKADIFQKVYNEGKLLPLSPTSIGKGRMCIYGGRSGKKFIEV